MKQWLYFRSVPTDVTTRKEESEFSYANNPFSFLVDFYLVRTVKTEAHITHLLYFTIGFSSMQNVVFGLLYEGIHALFIVNSVNIVWRIQA